MSYREELKTLRYGDHIAQIFDALFEGEDWMDEGDRNLVVHEFLVRAGITLAEMNDAIQVGVDNGYSADEQAQISALALRQLKQQTTPVTAKDKE